MKWTALIFCLLTQPLFSVPNSLNPPTLTWDDVVKTIPTKKYTDTDGRIWTFRFHQSDAKLPEALEEHEYYIQLAPNGIQKYDPETTLFATYDVWQKCGANPCERMYHLAFYLLTPTVAQKENKL